MTEVLLVAEAMEDLERLKRAGVLPFALKKLVQLEQNAEIGEPLLGDLRGFQKLKFGVRSAYRLIYAAREEKVVVWVLGQRRDLECYRLAERRLQELGADPVVMAVQKALSHLRA